MKRAFTIALTAAAIAGALLGCGGGAASARGSAGGAIDARSVEVAAGFDVSLFGEEQAAATLFSVGSAPWSAREEVVLTLGRSVHNVSATYPASAGTEERFAQALSAIGSCDDEHYPCELRPGVWAGMFPTGMFASEVQLQSELAELRPAVRAMLARADSNGFAAMRALHEALGGVARVDQVVREATHFPGELGSRMVSVRYAIAREASRAIVENWLAARGQTLRNDRAQLVLEGRSAGVELLDDVVVLFVLEYPIGERAAAAPEDEGWLHPSYPPDEMLDEVQREIELEESDPLDELEEDEQFSY